LVAIPGLAAVLYKLVDVLFFLNPCHVFLQMVVACMLLFVADMLKTPLFRLLLGFFMMMVVVFFLLLFLPRSCEGLEDF
jgi:hypothetical protein